MTSGRGQFCWLRIPDYPLWAWHQLEPSLKDRELLIVQASKVLTCTPALQELGVVAGMAADRAQALTSKLAPLIRPEPGERGLFLWEEVLTQIYRLTPRLEEHRGRFFLLAELETDEARQLAAEVPLCAGWAHDRNSAYLACLIAPCGQVCEVPPGQEKVFRDNLSCLHLLAGGVSSEAIQRLIWLGFPTIGSLLRLSAEQLRSRFDKVDAGLFLLLGHGLSPAGGAQDRVHLYYPPEVISVTHIFDPPLREPVIVPEIFQRLLTEAITRLGDRIASWLGCRIQTDQGGLKSKRRFLKLPTGLAQKLGPIFKSCWEDSAGPFEWEKLTLELGGLKRQNFTQFTLFQERSPWATFLPTFQSRFPGKLLRIDTVLESAYLPEESFAWSELGAPAAKKR